VTTPVAGRLVNGAEEAPAITDATVVAAKEGDCKAWEELYTVHARGLYGFLMLRLSDKDDAAEALSETFLRALEKIKGFRGDSRQVRAWLFTIARNVSTDRLRRRRRLTLQGELPEVVDVSNGEPTDALIASEDRDALQLALEVLPADDRDVLWLRIGQGLSSEEVGTILGKKPGAIRMQQLRALRTLTGVFEA
jgi:RNA polymerase sigma-70 factor (ECF subfamily)